MEKTAELSNNGYKYRFTMSADGRTVTVDQYDNGERNVDGTKRNPQWIRVWVRSL
jgi:hypothetical protein